MNYVLKFLKNNKHLKGVLIIWVACMDSSKTKCYIRKINNQELQKFHKNPGVSNQGTFEHNGQLRLLQPVSIIKLQKKSCSLFIRCNVYATLFPSHCKRNTSQKNLVPRIFQFVTQDLSQSSQKIVHVTVCPSGIYFFCCS